jgi:hypothetical protein
MYHTAASCHTDEIDDELEMGVLGDTMQSYMINLIKLAVPR